MAKDSWGKVKNLLGLEIEEEYEEEIEEQEEKTEDDEQKSLFNKKPKKEKLAVSKNNSQVLVVEPEFFNDAPVICDNLKNNKTVVVNLENADFEDGRKIFDFLNGAVYALDGTIQKISENVFILAPSTVDVITEELEPDNTKEFLDWNYEK
ncbi:MAG: cell division protein SepF [Eubacteriaceae bacterium]|nr:cell division protein SepF [Eubacteriaceae bacterium]